VTLPDAAVLARLTAEPPVFVIDLSPAYVGRLAAEVAASTGGICVVVSRIEPGDVVVLPFAEPAGGYRRDEPIIKHLDHTFRRRARWQGPPAPQDEASRRFCTSSDSS